MDESPIKRKGSVLQTMGAVAWSFFGVRRSVDHAQDVQKLNPLHVVVAGVIGVLLFIAVLVLLVHWVIGSGVAA
jgi:amino acid transporter